MVPWLAEGLVETHIFWHLALYSLSCVCGSPRGDVCPQESGQWVWKGRKLPPSVPGCPRAYTPRGSAVQLQPREADSFSPACTTSSPPPSPGWRLPGSLAWPPLSTESIMLARDSIRWLPNTLISAASPNPKLMRHNKKQPLCLPKFFFLWGS